MEFEQPSNVGFTIYSKSGCSYCIKAKTLMKENKLPFNIINCDKYIIEDKQKFLNFITQISGKEVKTFPIIFLDNKFLGGYTETNDYVDELLLCFDENLTF